MNLSDHDLSQIDEPYVRSLSHAQKMDLLLKTLDDLKVARDRLNQTPQNSSMPPGSQAPWAGNTGPWSQDEANEVQVPPDSSPGKSSQSSQSESSDESHGNDTDEHGEGAPYFIIYIFAASPKDCCVNFIL